MTRFQMATLGELRSRWGFSNCKLSWANPIIWCNLLLATLALLIEPVTCYSQGVTYGGMGQTATGAIYLRDICRLKGQEENTLQGWGLVVGLKGTGDESSAPTRRALARFTQLLGGNVGTDSRGIPLLEEVEDTRNVAQVMVTAKVPPAGVQQGDVLDCHISAISAKSLVGGTLLLAPLLGPRADQPVVYALAQGRISLPNPLVPTTGVIYGGCKMESTITNEFVSNGKVTLVIDRDLDSFSNASIIQDAIDGLNQAGAGGDGTTDSRIEVKAIGQHHVEVTIPRIYENDPVRFVSFLLDQPLTNIKKKKRVVINEAEGVIVMGEDVMISPVAITHKNLTIEAGQARPGFTSFDPSAPKTPGAKLQNLVEALNALNVSTDDMIAIIRTLQRNGGLFGEVVIY